MKLSSTLYDYADRRKCPRIIRIFRIEDARASHPRSVIKAGGVIGLHLRVGKDGKKYPVSGRENEERQAERDNEEKHEVVNELLAKDEIAAWSNRRIAVFVGVGPPLVGKVRKESGVIGLHLRVGKDGKTYPKKARSKRTAPTLADQSGAYGSEF